MQQRNLSLAFLRTGFFKVTVGLFLSLCVLTILWPQPGEARAGGGSSSGSRGSRTFTAPPSTSTAPSQAQPFERTMTQPSSPPSQSIFRPRLPSQPQSQRPGFFGTGFGGGFLGGLLGAGLFGLLLGHGLFGGIGGIFSLIGLLIQGALFFFLIRFLIRKFSPQPAGSSSFSSFAPSHEPSASYQDFSRERDQGKGSLSLQGEDYAAFEHLLKEIQEAFSAEDANRLRTFITPEMASYFLEQIAENARHGRVNRLSNIRFEKGDLAEAWREREEEYATVAMRFSLIDIDVDRNTQQVLRGNPSVPETFTEIWTFRRPLGTGAPGWRLSAIQQVS